MTVMNGQGGSSSDSPAPRKGRANHQHSGPQNATGILLIGGESRRFGSPKALARLGDQTLAEQAWETLGEVCIERIAVGKERDTLPLPFPLIDDGFEQRAPAIGVLAGLRASTTEVSIVVPVDYPLITPAVLHALVDACADAAVPKSWRQTGVLPGAFARSALYVFESRIAQKLFSLKGALMNLRVVEVEVDTEILLNVNTVADAELAAAKIRALRRSGPSLRTADWNRL